MNIEISSFLELFEVIRAQENKLVCYRGQSDANWELKPKIGRLKGSEKENTLLVEKDLLRIFKERSAPFIQVYPENEWEWLALAQHHGLATRLLDWSRNPLIAAYFSCNQHMAKDGALFIFHEKSYKNIYKNPNPFSLKGTNRYIPRSINERIVNQSGIFTIHEEFQEDFAQDPRVTKYIIKASYKRLLLKELGTFRRDKPFIFPGLDSLSEHLNSLRKL